MSRRSSDPVRPPGPLAAGASPAPSATRDARRWALAALFAGAAAIAFAPILVRLSEVGPVATAFWRVALALPVLWLAHAWRERGRDGKGHGRGIGVATLVAGLCFAGDLAVWHWSIHFTSVANATLLANFAPVFVTLIGFLAFGQRFSATFLLGMAVALTGACALMAQSFRIGADHLFGDGLGLITALFYAGYIVAVGRARAQRSTMHIMAWSGLITALALLPVTLATEATLWPTTARAWAVVGALALVSHVGGQSLIAFALAHLPAAFSSVGLLLQPAIAAVLAWLLLAEPLGAWQAAGGIVILVGIVIARRGGDAPGATPSPPRMARR